MADGWCKPATGAKFAGVTTKTFRGWLKDGLPHSKLPTGHILVRYSSIDSYLERFEISENEIDKAVNQIMEGF